MGQNKEQFYLFITKKLSTIGLLKTRKIQLKESIAF